MSLAGLLTILDDDPQLHDVVSRAESDTITPGSSQAPPPSPEKISSRRRPSGRC